MDTMVGTVLRLEVKTRLLMAQQEYDQAEAICQAIIIGPKYDQRYGPALVLMAQIYLAQGFMTEARHFALTAQEWLTKREVWGWVQKCQEVLAQCATRPYFSASAYVA